MSKIQTRRSISVSGATYARFRLYCQAHKLSLSGVTETLVQRFLDSPEARNGAMPETKIRPTVKPVTELPFTF